MLPPRQMSRGDVVLMVNGKMARASEPTSELLRFASGANTPSVPSQLIPWPGARRPAEGLSWPAAVPPGDLEIEIVPLAKVIAR